MSFREESDNHSIMRDPCSFANVDEFICTKIHWCVDVRFKNHVLDCRVDLDFKVLGGDTTKLVRNSKYLGAYHLLCRTN